MRKDSEKDYQSEGVTKTVIGPDETGYVYKYFKEGFDDRMFSYNEQLKILEQKKTYFGDYIPETILIKDEGERYHIKQKYIKGKLLKFVDINTLSPDTLGDLLNLFVKYIEYCKDTGAYLDIHGYQKDINETKKLRKRRFMVYRRLYTSFLNSTNIIISQEGKVFMVDICDLNLEKPKKTGKLHKIKKYVREQIANIGIKDTLKKIKKTINKKRELSEALNTNKDT